MKFLLSFILLSLSLSSFASPVCDLTIEINGKSTTRKTVIGEGSHRSQYYASTHAMNAAIQDCQEKGGTNCKVTSEPVCKYHTSIIKAPGIGITDTISCKATAQGEIIETVELSKSEMKKLRQEALCEKLINCENNLIANPDVSANQLEKILLLKEKNNCE